MKNFNKLSFIILGLLALLVNNCKKMNIKEDSYQLSLNALIGFSSKYTLSNERIVEQTVKQTKFSSNYKTEVVFTLYFLSQQNDMYNISAHLDLYKTTWLFNDNLFGNEEYKTDDEEIALREGLDSLITGSNFRFTLFKDGTIIRFNGYDTVEEKIKTFYSKHSKVVHDLIPSHAFSGSYFKNMFEKIVRVLPGDSNSKDADWITDDSLYTIFGDLKFKIKNRISNADDNHINIKTTANISIPLKYKIPVLMNGTQEGNLIVNRNTGLLTISKSILKLNGVLKTDKLEMPYRITSIDEVKEQGSLPGSEGK